MGFTRVRKFDIEDFCIDFYFDKLTKRMNSFQSYAEFCDQEYRDILKHVNCTLVKFIKDCRNNFVAVCHFKELFYK